jgi:hypothetical protein
MEEFRNHMAHYTITEKLCNLKFCAGKEDKIGTDLFSLISFELLFIQSGEKPVINFSRLSSMAAFTF